MFVQHDFAEGGGESRSGTDSHGAESFEAVEDGGFADVGVPYDAHRNAGFGLFAVGRSGGGASVVFQELEETVHPDGQRRIQSVLSLRLPDAAGFARFVGARLSGPRLQGHGGVSATEVGEPFRHVVLGDQIDLVQDEDHALVVVGEDAGLDGGVDPRAEGVARVEDLEDDVRGGDHLFEFAEVGAAGLLAVGLFGGADGEAVDVVAVVVRGDVGVAEAGVEFGSFLVGLRHELGQVGGIAVVVLGTTAFFLLQFALLVPLLGLTDVLQEFLFEGPRVGNARIFLFLVVANDSGLGVALCLFAVLSVGFNYAPLDFVLVLEGCAFGFSLLFYHGCRCLLSSLLFAITI